MDRELGGKSETSSLNWKQEGGGMESEWVYYIIIKLIINAIAVFIVLPTFSPQHATTRVPDQKFVINKTVFSMQSRLSSVSV